jgi:hypothetical protein
VFSRQVAATISSAYRIENVTRDGDGTGFFEQITNFSASVSRYSLPLQAFSPEFFVSGKSNQFNYLHHPLGKPPGKT